MTDPKARDVVPPEPGDCQYRDALLVANRRRHEVRAVLAAVRAEVEVMHGEIESLKELVARRPAMDKSTLYENVAHAITMAGKNGDRAIAAEREIGRLKTSMAEHFQRDHLAGDGPEIDRWRTRVKVLEAQAATREQEVAASVAMHPACTPWRGEDGTLHHDPDCIVNELLNAKSELDCGSKRAECPCAACTERGLRAKVAELEAEIEDFAKVAEQTGQPGTAIGLRALLPAPRNPGHGAGGHF